MNKLAGAGSGRYRVLLGASIAGWVMAAANAGEVNLSYLQGTLAVAPDAISAAGPDLFGDSVSLYNGSLAFEQTDLSLPGNNSLPVALIRKHSAGRPREVKGQFGDWDLEVPRIGGTFASVPGWVTESGKSARCTGWSAPPSVTRSQSLGGRGIDSDPGWKIAPTPPAPPTLGWNKVEAVADAALFRNVTFLPFDYWQGTTLHVPGQGSQELLTRAKGYAAAPGGATAAYRIVTRNNWQIGCLPSIANGAGEGFLAISPEGVRYRFDWMATRPQPGSKKEGLSLGRLDFYLMATEVTDRFGNWVRYTYDPAKPLNLTRIAASDGRVITVNNENGRAVSASDGTRTFVYGYTTFGSTTAATVERLSAVTQPDGSRWAYDLGPLLYDNLGEVGDLSTCDFPGSYPTATLTGRITHPSGAVNTFTTNYVAFGRTGVPRYCWYVLNSKTLTYGSVWPKLLITQALSTKTITGPGIGTLSWNYSYATSSGWDTCTTCPDVSTTTVTDPGAVATRHTFGNRWHVNDGQLLQVDEGWNGASALRSTNYRYRSAAGQAYPDQFGSSLLRQNDLVATRNLPQDRRTVVQQSSSFTWEADASSAGFDSHARAAKVRKHSSLGDTRTESTVYEDNLNAWVLGQLKSVAEGVGALREMESNAYDPATSLRQSSSSFGKLMQSFTYNSDGTIATLSDAAGRITRLQSHARGSPQLVTLPDNSRESQVINNLGRPSSRTDAAGYTTGYEFDAMGRVSKVTHPGGYNPTLQSFTQVQSAEFGLPAGHWRQTISTGNARTVRYFDALWRKRIDRRYDSANEGGTASYQETRYDTRGQKSFESYPERGFSGVDMPRDGTRLGYDALNRMTLQATSSELTSNGQRVELSTTQQYPAGSFSRITTNPRGLSTVFGFQAFDIPSEAHIRSIQAPEGVQVTIARDVFGKPLAISRGGSGQLLTRSYTYDVYQRLCRTNEPETGATQQDYDTANNVAWRASGLTPQTGPCSASNAPAARRVSFSYDALNRLRDTTYGDGSPWVSRTYTPDGLPQTIATPTSIWTLSYSALRKLQSEVLDGGAVGSFPFSYSFDANGSVSSMTYPGGPTLQYSPDALGRPTAIPGYLGGATYHPNGQLASYAAANGVHHAAAQNLRLLPASLTYGNVSAETYQYDANANVVAISGVNPRSMGYDGLDRLTVANGIWGQGSYSYDTLDNIRSSTLGNIRSLVHDYADGTNRLTGVRGSIIASLVYDANGNVVNRAGQGYSFDIGNRLTAATNLATYYYDGLGRRAYTAANNGRTTIRLYGQAGQLLMTIDNQKGATQHFYLGSKLVAEYNSHTLARWVHTDALGSPVAATNANGALVDRSFYEPYGLPTANGTNPDGIGFTGHVNDVDTGLVYMQQRYYDPIAGRFLSVDPVTTNLKNGSSFNRFVYAKNNPYTYIDPDGRDPCTGSRIGGCAPGALAPGFSGCVSGTFGSSNQSSSNGVSNHTSITSSGGTTSVSTTYSTVGDLARALGENGFAFGRRPLEGNSFMIGTQGTLSDKLNIQILHEQVFYIERVNNVLVLQNLGFFDKGRGLIADPGFPTNVRSYDFGPISVGPLSTVELKLIPGFGKVDYRLFSNNCQSFCDSVRRSVSVD